jgi:hypothetical protein
VNDLAQHVVALSAFEQWCKTKSVNPLPASPGTVAAFVANCEPFGIAKLVQIVDAISSLHTARGYADPTCGPVSAELNRIGGVGVPRSWKKERWPAFLSLPYRLQLYVLERERQDREAVRRSHGELDRLRNELEKLKETA